VGLYEIAQGLYEIAAIISEAVESVFQELLGCKLAPKTSGDNQWTPVGQIEMITDAERANAIGSPVPMFTDEERRNAVSIPEPLPTKKFTSNVFHCNSNRPLMSYAEKNNPDTLYAVEPFLGIFPAHEPKNGLCKPVVITEEDRRNAIAYEPIFSLDDPSLEESSLEMASASWEKLKEPITKIGIGILYFLPVIGTIYSINQLLSSCNTES
jgi:hypothetical protein